MTLENISYVVTERVGWRMRCLLYILRFLYLLQLMCQLVLREGVFIGDHWVMIIDLQVTVLLIQSIIGAILLMQLIYTLLYDRHDSFFQAIALIYWDSWFYSRMLLAEAIAEEAAFGGERARSQRCVLWHYLDQRGTLLFLLIWVSWHDSGRFLCGKAFIVAVNFTLLCIKNCHGLVGAC